MLHQGAAPHGAPPRHPPALLATPPFQECVLPPRPRRAASRPSASRSADGPVWVPVGTSTPALGVDPADAPAPADAPESLDPLGIAPDRVRSVQTTVDHTLARFREAVRHLGRTAGDAGDDGASPLGPDTLGPDTLGPDTLGPDLTFGVESDRWADEGGPLGRRYGPQYAGGHRLAVGERAAWEDREVGRDQVHAAAGAYARALRREGAGLPAALLTVRVIVAQEASGRLPRAVYTSVQRDAARCCLEAFYAH